MKLFLAICLAGALPAQEPYRNADLFPEQRAADLVSRMTLEEKVLQMQNTAPAIPRLGIPAYDWWNEGLHGVARAGIATVFPQAIGLAATWNTDLLHRIADTISTEARAKYNDAILHGNHGRYFGLTFWSPNINIFRDPRWGRGQETYGEDPYLTSRMAVAFITGLQGNDPNYFKTIATAKHFAVHSGPELSRHVFDVHPTARDLNETYLPAFRASIVEGRADSVMCAYNRVDGMPACANPDLLQKKLREEWGFKGYVVSDCGAIGDIVQGHKYKETMPAGAAAAVEAGTDLACGTEYRALVEAVKSGLLPEGKINRSAERLFAARFRLGMFDPPERVPFSSIPFSEVDSAAHRQLALEAARESIVLLRNSNQLLPLGNAVHRIAVIGPAADDPEALLGNYNGTPSHIVTPLEGIERQFHGQAEVRFALGSTYTAQSSALVPASALKPDGLLAEYFDNAEFRGEPAVSREEPRVFFDWDTRDPIVMGHVPRQEFSVRWSGAIHVARTGDYPIGTTRLRCADCPGNDSARLFIDNKLVVEDNEHTTWFPRTRTGVVHLEAGRAYNLRVEYRQRGGAAGIQLSWMPPPALLLDEAAEAVKSSDVVIACVGLNANLEGEEMPTKTPGFSGGDRTTIDLPAGQQQLLRVALDSGKPVVLVLASGSAVAVPRAGAILQMWYGGEEGGTAIAETLAGKNNPAGRLPVTFYRSVDQLPPFDDYSMNGRTYRYFKGEPLFPFGYGLSYSTFRYSDQQVRDTQVSVRVTNTSQRDGDEVSQLYVGGELRGFERIHLAAGETRTVTFALPQPSGNIRITGSGADDRFVSSAR